MNTQIKTGNAKQPDTARQNGPVEHDPGLQVVRWFAGYFDSPFSEIAVVSRLPLNFDLGQPDMMIRALETVALKSESFSVKLRKVDPIVLPCLAYFKTGTPLIVMDLDKKRGVAMCIDLTAGAEVREIKLRTLQQQIRKNILLVTPEDNRKTVLGPRSARPFSSTTGHWFWTPVRANWGSWAQIVTASLLANFLGLALPLFIMNVYDKVIPGFAFVTLWTLSLGVGLAILTDLALRVLRTSILERVGRRVDLKVGSSLFRHALSLSILHRSDGAAGLASQIREFEPVREFFASATLLSLIDVIFVGIFVAVLFVIVGPLAWVPLLAIPLILAVSISASIPLGRMATQAIQVATRRHVVLMETLDGIESVKSLNAEPVLQREWENAVAASARVNGRTRFWSSFSVSTSQLIQQGVSVSILVWGVYLVSRNEITVGGLIAANILAGRAMAPLSMISQTIFRAQHASKSMKTLERIMQLPTDRHSSVRSSLRVRRGAIEMDEVEFTYPGAQVPAITEMSIKFEPGEVVSLLGRVGSGKTTMGKMLNGLLVPQKGVIKVDGFGLNQFEPAELRDAIGYLPQNNNLFTGTLRENLLIGYPGATQEEIERALDYAGLSEFVASSPEGLDMFINEKGSRLSGGQAQALALARLLVKRPKFLFLDEPTNAMDTEMETHVADRLRALQNEGVCLILCTHKRSLAEIADRVVVLDKGKKMFDGRKEDILQRTAGKPDSKSRRAQ